MAVPGKEIMSWKTLRKLGINRRSRNPFSLGSLLRTWHGAFVSFRSMKSWFAKHQSLSLPPLWGPSPMRQSRTQQWSQKKSRVAFLGCLVCAGRLLVPSHTGTKNRIKSILVKPWTAYWLSEQEGTLSPHRNHSYACVGQWGTVRDSPTRARRKCLEKWISS